MWPSMIGAYMMSESEESQRGLIIGVSEKRSQLGWESAKNGD
jgi:hypothetical protein